MLKILNLSKKYKTGFIALKNINIEFGNKGLIFITGKSGSGKTTLMNILGGLDKYSDGEIMLDNISTKFFNQKQLDKFRNYYLGFIFQEYNLLKDFTVAENISIALELQDKKALTYEIDDILKQMDLQNFKNSKINEISGGQKQRVAIARALVKKPKIILADEPTGALDSVTGKQILEIIKKISKNKLVIIISHDLNAALNYGDRIIEMKDGQIVSDKINNANIIETLDKKINNKNENFSFNKKTSNLNFAKSFKIAFKYFKYKPINMFLNILLTIFSLVFFGVGLCFALYNKNETIYNSFKKNSNMILISKMNEMNNTEIQKFIEEYTDNNWEPVYTFDQECKNIFKQNFNENLYYICDIFQLTEKQFVKYDLKFEELENYFKIKGLKITQMPSSQEFNFFIPQFFIEKIKEMIEENYNNSDIELKNNALQNFQKICSKIGIIKNNIQENKRFDDVKNLKKEEITKMYEDPIRNLIKIASYNLFEINKNESYESNFYISESFLKQAQIKNSNLKLKFFRVKSSYLQDEKLKKLISDHTKNINTQNSKFTLSSPMVHFADSVEPIFKKISYVFIFISFNYFLFAIVLIFNFISSTIKDKKKEIGILRAIGASSKDVCNIFLKEILLIFFIISTISCLVIKSIIWYGNYLISNLIWVHIIKFGLYQIITVSLTSLIILLISCFIQIFNITIKKPIDIILEK
ncbi:MAG: ATP-binding cassette domain-containing protein [Phytoplasma sp.]|uniref:ABC transporter ATP-binding protein/permease n=1 Tax=Phytoplasma sp. TaxID=2155 RepID=UPI002B4118EC|nr:ATP-binding cassette domain-containing protein [Phytoplasma sp.]WRH06796.1 MAG: ATP-binding cassette domain-containing protein [Phytoplasma sp.]